MRWLKASACYLAAQNRFEIANHLRKPESVAFLLDLLVIRRNQSVGCQDNSLQDNFLMASFLFK